MPPLSACPLIFLKHVLSGRKKALIKSDVQINEVKKYAEFTVNAFYDYFKDDEKVM